MSSRLVCAMSMPRNSCVDSPMKTPVCVPASADGAIPACSTAVQAVSSISRCWGSMNIASRADTPKNDASKPAKSSRNPARRATILPSASGSGSKNSSTSHRSAGTSDTASLPSVSRFQNSSASAAPGKRTAYPSTAKPCGSVTTDHRPARRRCAVAVFPGFGAHPVRRSGPRYNRRPSNAPAC